MTRLLFACFAAITILSACRKPVPACMDCDFDCITVFDDAVITSSDCLDDHTCSFEVLTDTKVDFDEVSGMNSSTNSFVINFSTKNIDDPNIADDEIFTSFLLEIPNENDSFSVSGEEVQSINASVKRSCFCPNVEWKLFEKGCIQGEKKDGVWFVQGNVSVDLYESGDDVDYKFDFQVQ